MKYMDSDDYKPLSHDRPDEEHTEWLALRDEMSKRQKSVLKRVKEIKTNALQIQSLLAAVDINVRYIAKNWQQDHDKHTFIIEEANNIIKETNELLSEYDGRCHV